MSNDLHYRKLQEIRNAKLIADQFRNIHPHIAGTNDLPLDLKGREDAIKVYGHGYPVIYLPHEIRILRAANPSYVSEASNAGASYPENVRYTAFTGPTKEYARLWRDGRWHYFVIPAEGLRLHPTGKGEYRVMNYRPDYHISISRKKANAARSKYKEFFEYLDSIWELADLNSECEWFSWRELGDREKWYGIVLSLKSTHKYGYGQPYFDKEAATQEVFDNLPWLEMAYNVAPTPTTETSHSRHWYEYERLADAGLLDGAPRKF